MTTPANGRDSFNKQREANSPMRRKCLLAFLLIQREKETPTRKIPMVEKEWTRWARRKRKGKDDVYFLRIICCAGERVPCVCTGAGKLHKTSSRGARAARKLFGVRSITGLQCRQYRGGWGGNWGANAMDGWRWIPGSQSCRGLFYGDGRKIILRGYVI